MVGRASRSLVSSVTCRSAESGTLRSHLHSTQRYLSSEVCSPQLGAAAQSTLQAQGLRRRHVPATRRQEHSAQASSQRPEGCLCT